MALTKITDASAEPLSIDQVLRHLKIDYFDDDERADIGALITVARTAAEDRLQATLLPTTWRLTLDRFPLVNRLCAPQVRLPMGPVISIISANYRDPLGVLTALPDTARRLEGDLLIPAFGATWPSTAIEPGAVRIDYQAGYATAQLVPAPIRQWILLAIGDIYANRQRSGERPAVPQGFADGLLDPYRAGVI